MALTKRLNASANLLDFLIWALISLFGTRLFLVIFNYPTVGRGNWHIAHVLWGGVFMLLGIIFFLIFYSRSAFRYASIFSGIGWGLFIDEIGKYVTRDNNYWFRPAIIFIYISFILLFFIYRLLEKKSSLTYSSLWISLLEDCQELINHDLEKREKRTILRKISLLETHPLSQHEKKILGNLRSLVLSSPVLKNKNEFSPGVYIASLFNISYTRFFHKKIVFYSLIVYSFWYFIDKLIDLTRLALNTNRMQLIQYFYRHYDFFSTTEVYMVSIKFIVETIVAFFIAAGLYFWVGKQYLKGLRFYQWGLLINIFIASLFKFYFEQFSAVFSLIASFILLGWLTTYRKERRFFVKKLRKK
ncbi:hypothetical protein KBB48_01725 [Candidatus Shapirobacteria bacterium]|nr:hypothetical protein [Candidatus Shapirobacteria bacterium]